MKNVMFTGYRPKKFRFELKKGNIYYDELINNLNKELFKILEADEDTTFYCGGAMGFDIIAAEEVLKLKESFKNLKLCVVVPFKNQSGTFYYDWQKRYNALLDKADEIIILSENYFSGCYFVRNKKMVDLSSSVITFYDGQGGGTKQTLDYAARRGLEIINLYNE